MQHGTQTCQVWDSYRFIFLQYVDKTFTLWPPVTYNDLDFIKYCTGHALSIKQYFCAMFEINIVFISPDTVWCLRMCTVCSHFNSWWPQMAMTSTKTQNFWLIIRHLNVIHEIPSYVSSKNIMIMRLLWFHLNSAGFECSLTSTKIMIVHWIEACICHAWLASLSLTRKLYKTQFLVCFRLPSVFF